MKNEILKVKLREFYIGKKDIYILINTKVILIG